jgi:hypothetical protein
MAKDLKEIISAVNSGTAIPVIDLVRSNPQIPAVISKLISSSDQSITHDNRGNRKIGTTGTNNFSSISNSIASKVADAESIVELFPDMELSAQILISSILSPNDMTSNELNLTVPTGLKCSDFSGSLITEVKDFISKDYKIESLLPIILRRVLFESGSYPMVVIPESSIDELINGSNVGLESLTELTKLTDKDKKTFKSIGILGDPDIIVSSSNESNIRLGLESIMARGPSSLDNYNHYIKLSDTNNNLNNLVTVTDNFTVLRLPEVYEKTRNLKVKQQIGLQSKISKALESNISKLNDTKLTSLMYKAPRRNSEPIRKIKTSNETDRRTIGAPLILKLPSESVIPVFTPGAEENHVGYFVLLDMEGNPINKANMNTGYGDLQSRLNQNSSDMSSVLLARAKSVYGNDCGSLTPQMAATLYADIIESDLLARLRNGIYGKELSLGKNEEIYRLMLSRSLKAQYTQILFIPVDLVTYFAYKYDNRGIGKSLVDDLRILNSLRAMVLFSKVMAELKNSIGRTDVKIELDPDDPNPQKTIETAIHEVSKTRQQAFPLGISSPGDLVDWVQRSGMSFQFSNHPALPEVKIDFSETNSNYTKPDSDLEEDLRKRAIMSLGLNPETVDNGYAGEFATSIVANNLLLNKRVLQIQDVFVPQITDHIRKVLSNHGTIIEKLTEIVSNNFDKFKDHFEVEINEENKEAACSLVVQEFIQNLEATLPQPNSVTLENQIEAFKKYSEALDEVLKHYISAESIPAALAGEAVNEKIEQIKEVVKAYYCRRWLNENNVLSELTELVAKDEKGEPLLDLSIIQKDHIESLTKSVLTLFNTAKKTVDAANSDMSKLEVSDNSISSDSTSSSVDENNTTPSTPESDLDDKADIGDLDDLKLPPI